MIKFKKAFTLAEILIALGIVGVVAAIVIPLVSQSVQKNQSGATLGRAVQQIEIGCQNLIQVGNSRSTNGSITDVLSGFTLTDIGITDATDTIPETSPVLSILPLALKGYCGYMDDSGDLLPIKTYSGADNETDNTRVTGNVRRCKFSKFNAGIAFYFDKETLDTGALGRQDLAAFTGFVIYFDTNGWNNLPNCAGKDIFAFKLLNNGTLVPEGTTEAGTYARQVVDAGFKIKY